jgi:excisionase family DNA binding protein
MHEKSKEYYTTQETAERLGRNESTIRRWCLRGLMEGAIKAGLTDRSHWRIPVQTVETIKLQIGAE